MGKFPFPGKKNRYAGIVKVFAENTSRAQRGLEIFRKTAQRPDLDRTGKSIAVSLPMEKGTSVSVKSPLSKSM
jgi:hypothetical protein